MSDEAAAVVLMQFLKDVGDAPEVLWTAALAMIGRSLDEAGQGVPRFRTYPVGQLRRLRGDVARGMQLARMAAALQEADTAQYAELSADLHEGAVAAVKSARRAQTLPAEIARLRKQKRRAAGADHPAGNFHLAPDYPLSGLAAAERCGGTGKRSE